MPGTEIQGMILGAGATLLAGGVAYGVNCLRKRIRIPTDVSQLQRGVFAILRVTDKQGECLAAMLATNQTILEVIRDGKINGNIAKAFGKKDEAERHLHVASEISQTFLQEEAVSKHCEDGK